MRIEINSSLGKADGSLEKWDKAIREITNNIFGLQSELQEISYHTLSTSHPHQVGDKTKMYIFNKSTFKIIGGGAETTKEIQTLKINGAEIDNVGLIYLSAGQGVVFVDDNGVPYAEYRNDERLNMLNILFDITERYNKSRVDVLQHLLEQVDKIQSSTLPIISLKNKEYKSQIINIIKKDKQETEKENIKKRKREVTSINSYLQETREKLKHYNQRLSKVMRKIAISEEDYKAVNANEKDIELILQIKQVTDLTYSDQTFNIFTTRLTCTDEAGTNYSLGRFKISINMDNTKILFSSDEGRPGYWTQTDPHPHVNGSDGKPCWGNMDATIAELCDKQELYAIVLSCIDYLESVNRSDAAGIKISRWDIIESDGSITPSPYNKDGELIHDLDARHAESEDDEDNEPNYDEDEENEDEENEDEDYEDEEEDNEEL